MSIYHPSLETQNPPRLGSGMEVTGAQGEPRPVVWCLFQRRKTTAVFHGKPLNGEKAQIAISTLSPKIQGT